MIRHRRSATPAWVTLAVSVTAYDIWALSKGSQTLSAGFYQAWRHPVARWPVLVAWGYLTAHLFLGPEWQWDPVQILFKAE